MPDSRLKLLDGHLRRDLDPDMEVDVEILDVNDEEARTLLLSIDPLAALAETEEALHERFGLEALFGDTDQPVKANLAKRISAWLPGTSDVHVRDLYKNRCEAVHGRWLDDNRIFKGIEATEDLLRRSLIKCIETRTTPLHDWK